MGFINRICECLKFSKIKKQLHEVNSFGEQATKLESMREITQEMMDALENKKTAPMVGGVDGWFVGWMGGCGVDGWLWSG